VQQIAAIRQLDGRAVDALNAFAIDQKQMIDAGRAGNIDIFAQFDGAFGADDEQPPVAPGRQAIGREPVNADVAARGFRAQQHLAEILQSRRLRIGAIGDRRRHHLGVVGSGEKQKLLALMRCDVGEDAAIFIALEKPLRPRRLVQAVRPEPGRMDDTADGAGLDQLAGLHSSAGLEMLGKAHRINQSGLGLNLAHRGKLLKRRDARLVGHEILAVAHDVDAERGALARNGGADDQLDRLVVQNFSPVADALGMRIFFDKPVEQAAVRVKRDKLAAGGQQAVDLPENVAVIDADDRKADFIHATDSLAYLITSAGNHSEIAGTKVTSISTANITP
jgi:hypothetical protein